MNNNARKDRRTNKISRSPSLQTTLNQFWRHFSRTSSHSHEGPSFSVSINGGTAPLDLQITTRRWREVGGMRNGKAERKKRKEKSGKWEDERGERETERKLTFTQMTNVMSLYRENSSSPLTSTTKLLFLSSSGSIVLKMG